jgi:pentatricopeptide repeat protein
MDRSESTLGTRFDWRSEIVGMLAVVYCLLSKWEDAETMLGEIFEQKQEVMSMVARAYCRLGNWEKAASIIDHGDSLRERRC